MKLDPRRAIEEDPYAVSDRELLEEIEELDVRSPLSKIIILVAVSALVVAFFLLSGCAAQERHTASLGLLSNGDHAALQGRYATFEQGKVGFFASLGAGGNEPSGVDYDKDGPGNPLYGPDGLLSRRSGDGDAFMAVGAAGGVTYQMHRNVAVLLGMSLWGEQAYSEYSYSSAFADGRYYVKEDIETEVGVVVGIEFFNASDWTLGLQYDSAPGEDGMFGVSVGWSF